MSTNISKSGGLISDEVSSTCDTIYLGHIPYGFFEPQIKKFFSQFGPIKNFSLKRSIKTGNSKGYAFIQFKIPAIAAIAANTMHGYILFGRSLVCKVVDSNSFHPNMIKRYNTIPLRASHRKETKPINKAEDNKITPSKENKIINKLRKKQKKFSELNIHYPIELFLPQINTDS